MCSVIPRRLANRQIARNFSQQPNIIVILQDKLYKPLESKEQFKEPSYRGKPVGSLISSKLNASVPGKQNGGKICL